MNNIFKFFIFILFFFPSLASAGFDFGGDEGGCDGGSGNFQQQINYYGGVDTENAITVGTIPSGLTDVSIALKSSQDVDIRLYAGSVPIVHWPNGLLSGAGSGTISYQGVTIKYSGYDGDGTGLGHEYIKITGTTNTSFVMKAFGYAAGFAEVDYSWAGKANCTGGSTPSASGSGDFKQQIIQNDIVTVGDIPPGINNLYIMLKSSNDVDIQLYDKDNGTKIIGWPDGRLNGSSQQSTTYQEMQIEWSGYDGDGTGVGNEYIKITGLTTLNLTMKAFGYQAGFAEIHYEWGSESSGGGTQSVTAPSALVATNVVDPTVGPLTLSVTPFIQIAWTDQASNETGYHIRISPYHPPGTIHADPPESNHHFYRPAVAGIGSQDSVVITSLPNDTYSLQVCAEGSGFEESCTEASTPFTIGGNGGNGGNNPTPNNCNIAITSVSPLGQYIHWNYNCNNTPDYFVINGKCGTSPFGPIGFGFDTTGTADINIGLGATGRSQVCAVFPNGEQACSNYGAAPCLNL